MSSHSQQQGREPLRVGIVLDSPKPPAWIAKIVQEVHAADFLHASIYVLELPGRVCSEACEKPASALFRFYLKQDGKRYAIEPDPLQATDLTDIFPTAPDLSKPESLGDVVLWLSAQSPDKRVLENSSIDVWRYRHGIAKSDGTEADYFWELYDRNPVSTSAVETLNREGKVSAVLVESSAVTEIGWSVTKNRVAPLWKASGLIMKCLRQLHGGNGTTEVACDEQPGLPERKTQMPTNAQMLRFFVRNSSRTAYRRLLYSNLEAYWFIAYRTNSEKFLSRVESFSPSGFRPIESPPGHFFADPFVWTRDGRSYIFIEDYICAKQKGVISVLPVDGDRVGPPEQVLEQPYHLSYPCIFEHHGELYMIPETLNNRRVELYRAERAPFHWELVAVLKDNISAADTTPWMENGIFYFFTSVAEEGVTANENLHLYYAESLTGKWMEHPDSPVCFDSRRSRSAGHLFRRNGRLIRPSQDCSVRYGFACQLNEIEKLSPERFLERPLNRIEPTWSKGLIGTHTLNSDQYIEVIDGQIYRRKHRDE